MKSVFVAAEKNSKNVAESEKLLLKWIKVDLGLVVRVAEPQ